MRSGMPQTWVCWKHGVWCTYVVHVCGAPVCGVWCVHVAATVAHHGHVGCGRGSGDLEGSPLWVLKAFNILKLGLGWGSELVLGGRIDRGH